MIKPTPTKTNFTLLNRALDLDDEEAWKALDENYRRYIYHLLHGLDVPMNDIEDFTQQIMVGLTLKLKQYDRTKGQFRSWLGKVVRNEVLMQYRKQKSRAQTLERYLKEVETKKSNDSSELEQRILKEWNKHLYSLALERIQTKTSVTSLRVMELTRQGCSTEEIALTIGIAETSVYNLRRIVKQHLTNEICELRRELEE